MAYAVNIRCDNDSSQPIRLLWERSSKFETSPSMEALRYPPHLTFAIYDEIRLSDLFRTFDSTFSELQALTLRFESLGHFHGPNALVLFAAPQPSAEIKALHEHLHSLIDTKLCRPNYRPASWVPHCSLATSIDASGADEAVAFAQRPIDPIEVTFDVADCASFLPVEILRAKALSVDA